MPQHEITWLLGLATVLVAAAAVLKDFQIRRMTEKFERLKLDEAAKKEGEAKAIAADLSLKDYDLVIMKVGVAQIDTFLKQIAELRDETREAKAALAECEKALREERKK